MILSIKCSHLGSLKVDSLKVESLKVDSFKVDLFFCYTFKERSVPLRRTAARGARRGSTSQLYIWPSPSFSFYLVVASGQEIPREATTFTTTPTYPPLIFQPIRNQVKSKMSKISKI